MKATGAEITQFWAEWPAGEDWYCDFGGLDVVDDHDQPLLDPEKKYNVEDLGALIWQGEGGPPDGEDTVPATTIFARWRKSRTTQTFFVNVPNADADEFKALCKQRGWKTP